VQVRLRGGELNQHGYLVDICELEGALAKIVARFSDQTLNDLARFADLNPSLERFARVIHEDLHAMLALKDLSLAVKLWENERDWAAYDLE
jgi:6-pyruvoyltetrahydropterin/6-carboxytetrahydropterin synthase